MNKFVTTLLLSLLCICAWGQEGDGYLVFDDLSKQMSRQEYREMLQKEFLALPRFELTVGGSFTDLIQQDKFKGVYGYSQKIIGPLDFLYRDYDGPLYSTSFMDARFTWHALRWLSLSATAGTDILWHERFSPSGTGETGIHTGAAFYLVPALRFNYHYSEMVKIYGYLAAGACFYSGFDRYFVYSYDESGNEETSKRILFEAAGQIVPFGISIGKKFFGFAELGYGSLFTGVHYGIGYRF